MNTKLNRRSFAVLASTNLLVNQTKAFALGPFCVWAVRTILVRSLSRSAARATVSAFARRQATKTAARTAAAQAARTGGRRAVVSKGKVAVPAGTAVAAPSDAAAASRATIRRIESGLSNAYEYALDAGIDAYLSLEGKTFFQLKDGAPFVALADDDKIDKALSTYKGTFSVQVQNTGDKFDDAQVDVKLYDFDQKSLVPIRGYSVSLPPGDRVNDRFEITRRITPGRKTLVTFINGEAVDRSPAFYVG